MQWITFPVLPNTTKKTYSLRKLVKQTYERAQSNLNWSANNQTLSIGMSLILNYIERTNDVNIAMRTTRQIRVMKGTVWLFVKDRSWPFMDRLLKRRNLWALVYLQNTCAKMLNSGNHRNAGRSALSSTRTSTAPLLAVLNNTCRCSRTSATSAWLTSAPSSTGRNTHDIILSMSNDAKLTQAVTIWSNTCSMKTKISQSSAITVTRVLRTGWS